MHTVPGGRAVGEFARKNGRCCLTGKAYCAFADAAATHDTRQFLNAAAEFDKAIEAWPSRMRKNPKHTPPEPVSPALRVFAAIARLQASTQPEAVAGAARQEIAAALESPLCNSNLMSASSLP